MASFDHVHAPVKGDVRKGPHTELQDQAEQEGLGKPKAHAQNQNSPVLPFLLQERDDDALEAVQVSKDLDIGSWVGGRT